MLVNKSYNLCDSCDGKKVLKDYKDYVLSKQDERVITTETDNDRLFQAYVSAIAVLHGYMSRYPNDPKAKAWLDENVADYYKENDL